MSKVKKVPIRKCLGCGEHFEKRNLVRVVKNKEGQVALDKTGRMNGRGAYICNQSSCLESALKKKALQRALETQLTDDVIAALKEAIQHD